MSFRLLVECSKDIDELHINFSDGTSSVVEKPDKPKQIDKSAEVQKTKISKESKEHKEPRKSLDTYLDTEEDYTVQQEIIKKPEIAELNRPAKVSDELQNLDF